MDDQARAERRDRVLADYWQCEWSIPEIGRRHGVSKDTVAQIVGRAWSRARHPHRRNDPRPGRGALLIWLYEGGWDEGMASEYLTARALVARGVTTIEEAMAFDASALPQSMKMRVIGAQQWATTRRRTAT